MKVKGRTSKNKVSKLGLTCVIPFEFCDSVKVYNLQDIYMDDLYEEYGTVQAVINTTRWQTATTRNAISSCSLNMRSLL